MRSTRRTRVHVRFASGVYWFYFIAIVLEVAIFSSLAIAGHAEIRSGALPFATGIFGVAIGVPVLVIFLMQLRPLVLTDSQLRIPKIIGHKIIRISDVAGVGLLYRWIPMSRVPAGWVLNIWDKDGEKVEISKVIVATWRNPPTPGAEKPKGLNRIGGRPESAPFPYEKDPERLATTHPAKVARQIYDWVFDIQGATGPLAVQELQKKVKRDPWASTKTVGWWSPDVIMGRIT
jgi:hypothetical protein